MPALLVIDIQNGLTHDKKLFNESLFFQTVNNTIKKFRTQGYTIIFFQHNNKQLVQDSNAWQIDSRIDKDHGDIIIQKFHADAFEGTALQDVLGRKGIREIMVCGLVTHGCIRSTCLGGLKNHYRTGLLKGGHTNWHKNAEFKIEETEKELAGKGVHIGGDIPEK